MNFYFIIILFSSILTEKQPKKTNTGPATTLASSSSGPEDSKLVDPDKASKIRERNKTAAKKSRQKKKQREETLRERAQLVEAKNSQLKVALSAMEKEVAELQQRLMEKK